MNFSAWPRMKKLSPESFAIPRAESPAIPTIPRIRAILASDSRFPGPYSWPQFGFLSAGVLLSYDLAPSQFQLRVRFFALQGVTGQNGVVVDCHYSSTSLPAMIGRYS